MLKCSCQLTRLPLLVYIPLPSSGSPRGHRLRRWARNGPPALVLLFLTTTVLVHFGRAGTFQHVHLFFRAYRGTSSTHSFPLALYIHRPPLLLLDHRLQLPLFGRFLFLLVVVVPPLSVAHARRARHSTLAQQQQQQEEEEEDGWGHEQEECDMNDELRDDDRRKGGKEGG